MLLQKEHVRVLALVVELAEHSAVYLALNVSITCILTGCHRFVHTWACAGPRAVWSPQASRR